MSRIYFEDLPSTNTPRNAANLNKLNNVVISSTEPNTGEEVWLQEGKNLFNGILRNVIISNTTGEETSSTTIKSSEYINVNSSTNYTMSTNATEHKYYYYYYNENKQFINTGSSGYDVNNHTFTTPQNCKYIRFALNTPTSTQIQIEQGSTATSYEAYIDKKIYTKNDNGVYEIFYDESNIGELEIIDITNHLALESGFAIANGAIYKQGKHIFGQVTVTGTFTRTQVKISTIPYFPKRYLTISGSIVQSDGEWGQAGVNAYVYIGGTGAIQVSSPTNAEAIRFELNYCTN